MIMHEDNENKETHAETAHDVQGLGKSFPILPAQTPPAPVVRTEDVLLLCAAAVDISWGQPVGANNELRRK